MNLQINKNDFEQVKANKHVFIGELIEMNIPYDVCAKISASMNLAFSEIEEKNKTCDHGVLLWCTCKKCKTTA